ncbi:hypothetical protein K505DRAFT_398304 [Melanomma pulvis-pyrius CBS 109.77]|uniref:Uncharacterized protein n=1 Tax=Melanomma pulvis-pyrius CBS 109.77 TaxID=1314802 RepID=A0A6A6WS13_9PLEO|nr:hypothetical protein K505DRAFT_398304 [Melanomma pulvis-pyrius CBS 109.77]
MAPLRLALFGLVASVHAVNLPSSYWVSWDTGPAAAPTKPPVVPSKPSVEPFPWPHPHKTSKKSTVVPPKTSTKATPKTTKATLAPPKTSNIISLHPPSYSVSWDTGSAPSPTDEPEPPVFPIPSDQISLGPPSYSISWDTGVGSGPTDVPEPPIFPTPSDQISLGPPSYSISWDTGVPAGPTATAEPTEDPEDPEYPPGPPATSNQISLGQPSASVSWNRRQEEEPEPTEVPEPEFPEEPLPEEPEDPDFPALPNFPQPAPSNVIGITPPKYTIIWGKRQDDEPEPTASPEEPEFPEFPEFPPLPLPTPPSQITLLPPKYSISWGKRQDEPEPTAFPEEPLPEEPEDPDSPAFPNFPQPTPSNDIGITPPKATIIWGKRQEDEPEPTDFPEPEPEDPEEPFPEEPEEPEFPFPAQPTPSNVIGITPPKATIIWGKREAAPATNSYGFSFPTQIVSFQPPKGPKPTRPVYVSWGKRQDDEVTLLPPSASISWGKREEQAPSDTYGLQFPSMSFSWWKPPPKPTSAHVSWGKRQDEDEPTEVPAPPLPIPTPPNQVTLLPPKASVSWGKREADAQFDTHEIHPTGGYMSWGKREAEAQDNTQDIYPTGGYLSWGKREAEAQVNTHIIHHSGGYLSWGRDTAPEPTGAAILVEREVPECLLTKTVTRPVPCPLIICPLGCPSTPPTDTEALLEDTAEGLDCPLTFTVPSKCPTCNCPTPIKPPTALPPSLTLTYKPTPPPIPTTFIIITPGPKPPITKPAPTGCPTSTVTVAPPCVPPLCPLQNIACDFNRVEPVLEKVRRVEKTIVTIKTISPIGTLSIGLPTPVASSCTKAVTKTVALSCPTYTCVPWCEAYQVVR